MKTLWFALLLSGGILWAQDSGTNNQSQDNSKASKGQITIRGCVSRSSGDYVLVQQNPAMTYALRGTGKTKIGPYLGHEVEVTGTKSPSMSTSSDALAKMGSPASETLTVTSIKTIAKECRY
jgi:hypothetical protein